MGNISEMALIDIAYEVVKESNEPMRINDIIDKVFELKGIEKTNELVSKLYVDFTSSSKFVYLVIGEGEAKEGRWDLKEKQSLEEFDKDGSAFYSKEDIVEAEDNNEEILVPEDDDEAEIDDEDAEDDEETTDEDDEDSEDDGYNYDDEESEVDDEDSEDDELDDDDNGFEEDKYNKYMDDYEDMYEN